MCLIFTIYLLSKKAHPLLLLATFRGLLVLTQLEIRFSIFIQSYTPWIIFGTVNKIILRLSFWLIISIVLIFIINLSDKNYLDVNWLTTLLIVILFLFFTSNNIIVFYLIFELSLIPIFIIVLGWGYQPERLKAGLRLIFYTLTGSLPLFGVISFFWFDYSKTVMSIREFGLMIEFWSIPAIIAFLIKTPMFLTHLWLPKAHVEAPVFGSILLAALLLKLGTYGVLVFINFIGHSWIGIFIIAVSFSSTILVRLICSRLLDIKLIVAYSSVAHIGIVLILLYLRGVYRVQRAIVIIIAHGFRSSAIFLIAHFLYLRSHSRAMLLNKIVLVNIPAMSLCWFIVLRINLAAPPTLNLVGEILIVVNIVSQIKRLSIAVLFMVLLSSVYTLVLYSSVSQRSELVISSKRPVIIRELLNVFIYLVPGWFLIFSLRLWI